jgi:hypothetical protein
MVYVDKTAYIFNLVNNGYYYFLSRPRRFGKSLLLSTMQAYFEGKRELFDGLYIGEHEREWTKREVLKIDFSNGKYFTLQHLQAAINMMLTDFEQRYGVTPFEGATPGTRMTKVIQAAYEQSGREIVVLVDEYDAPLFDAVEHPEERHVMRQTIRDMLSPLKGQGALIRFVFITGITKFSQMSVFSELNNLQNISMLPQYEGICGITEEELTTALQPDIELFAQNTGRTYEAALAELKDMYDGYHFAERMIDVYNPFSLFYALNSCKVDSYWFASATPTMMIEIMQHQQMDMDELEGVETSSDGFDTPIGETITDVVPLLFQSGYLSIKDYDAETETYTLGFPNREVRMGFARTLYKYVSDDYATGRNRLRQAYMQFRRSDDIEPFLETLRLFFAGYPYSLNNNNERHYQAVLYTLLVAYGADVEAERQTANGRIDIVLRMPKTIYVIELKYGRSPAEAMAQVKRKDYAAAFALDARPVKEVGISFSRDERTVTEWTITKQ